MLHLHGALPLRSHGETPQGGEIEGEPFGRKEGISRDYALTSLKCVTGGGGGGGGGV